MGIQLFPTLEGYERNYFLIHYSGDWKSVPLSLDKLDELAEQLEIEPFSSFINCTRNESLFDEEELEEFERVGELIDGVWYYEGHEVWSIEPKWFSPEQGLVTVRVLVNHLRSLQPEWNVLSVNDQDFDEDSENDQAAIGELDDVERILTRAKQEGRRFRICFSA